MANKSAKHISLPACRDALCYTVPSGVKIWQVVGPSYFPSRSSGVWSVWGSFPPPPSSFSVFRAPCLLVPPSPARLPFVALSSGGLMATGFKWTITQIVSCCVTSSLSTASAYVERNVWHNCTQRSGEEGRAELSGCDRVVQCGHGGLVAIGLQLIT